MKKNEEDLDTSIGKYLWWVSVGEKQITDFYGVIQIMFFKYALCTMYK